uniref:Nucleosome assembly protein C2D10.11C n=1 Tax=Dermatophagoides pteronyssinus TaxID=6956 RepID=A0A6P6YJJ6_DERPT|nr:putative nucleosome assembly protein C2D10.11C [Dermatophagoides pteronyssinus]
MQNAQYEAAVDSGTVRKLSAGVREQHGALAELFKQLEVQVEDDISVRFTVPEDMHSFAIDFAFYDNNPYFSNRVLTKEFMMRHDSQNGEWMLCQLHRIENLLSVELEIGQILRDRVIPDAFGYFFGVEGVSEDENDEY